MDTTTRRGALLGLLAAGGAVAVATPAEARPRKRRFKNKGRRPAPGLDTKGGVSIGSGDNRPTGDLMENAVLLNPLDFEDNHAASIAYVQCEKPARQSHTTCEANVPGVGLVTWPNPTD